MANPNTLNEQATPGTDLDRPLYTPIKRRSFFMYAGATAGATALVLAGCKKDETDNTPSLIDVGSGDGGILNYAYALEQLEAAFYAQIRTGAFYTNSTTPAVMKQVFDDLALHEAIHRDFLKAALTANNVTPLKDLTPDFSSIDFSSGTSILNAARTFEDTGVAAYNGAGRYITNNTYLGLAGKIVSVEARHAALIRDMITYNSFVNNEVVNVFTPTITGASATTVYSGEGSATSTPGVAGAPIAAGERSRKPQDVLGSVNAFLASGSKLQAPSYQ